MKANVEGACDGIENDDRGGHALKKIFLNAHPFLFTLDSLLYFWVKTRWETPPREILRPLLVLWVLLLVLYPLARKIAGSRDWAGILLTIFVLGFFFEEQYFFVVSVLTGGVLFVLLGYLALRKRQSKIFYVSSSLTLIGFTLLTVQSIALFVSLNSIPRSYYKAMKSRAKTLSIPLSEPASGIKPDIYYIVLDAYSGADVLEEFYDYDNSAFLDFLKGHGFIIPAVVLSNYPRTALSVSSLWICSIGIRFRPIWSR